MSQRCNQRHPNGSFCKRWASKGSPFCYRHQPPPEKPAEPEDDANLSPLDRLNTHDDLFDVVRESLNAIRLGRLSPGRAYATGYFIDLWMRVRERMEKAGPETKKFHKRRRMSDAVEQATFDLVAEKVVQVMTGRTIEEIERTGGLVTPPGEPHWSEKSLLDGIHTVRAQRASTPPPPGDQQAAAHPQDSSQQFPLPKNWGREEEKNK